MEVIDGTSGEIRRADALADGRQRLPEPEAEGQFAVGKVRHQLAQAPLFRTGDAVDLLLRKRRQKLVQARRGGGQDGDGLAAFEVFRVGILFHGSTVARLPAPVSTRSTRDGQGCKPTAP